MLQCSVVCFFHLGELTPPRLGLGLVSRFAVPSPPGHRCFKSTKSRLAKSKREGEVMGVEVISRMNALDRMILSVVND